MVSWDKMCRPKKLGGLEFRKTEATNKAFLSRLAWRVMSEEENLWIEVVRSKYLRKENCMERKVLNTDSWAWKKISKSKELLRKDIRWKLGNVKTINFWTNQWCGDESLLKLLNKDEKEVNLNLKVEEFIARNKVWKVER